MMISPAISLPNPVLPGIGPAEDGARRPDSWQHFAANGRFEVRLTRDAEDIADAQRLRYEVFYEEMSAQPSPDMAESRRDFDKFDSRCDHLMVYDHSRPKGQHVVGTYRLLRQSVAEKLGGFYSSSEFDLQPLLNTVGWRGGLLELGRSCVHPDYRNMATIQLLWRGISTYMRDNQITCLFGCASLAGTDPAVHAEALSYLHHHHLPPEEYRVRALPERFVDMNMRPRDAINMRSALQCLPPLVKGYLRLGCFIGDGAVIDEQFGTTDVFILLPVARISPKYHDRFVREDGLLVTV